MLVRLNKYIAESGLCSRRKADEYILDSKVKVNGKVVNELGSKIDDKKDKVIVGTKILNNRINKIYLMLNKPKGYVTTASDEYRKKNST